MVSPTTHDESRRVERMMAELRDLPRSTAFRQLSADEQKRIASGLRNLAAGFRTSMPESAPAHGRGESSALVPGRRVEVKQGSRVDVSQKARLGELINQVNFPAFVGGLLNGVFQANVDSSIQQMDAYSKLLSEVATTIEEGCKEC